MRKVKHQFRRGRTRLSAKNQATIPVVVLRRAGLKPGDEIQVEAIGTGRIVLSRVADVTARYAGCLTGVYARETLRRTSAGMALVVLDASVVIAFLDANDADHVRAAVVFRQPRADDPVLPASAFAEILVDPWRRGPDAAAVVRKFVTEVGIRIEPLTAEIADFAAWIRSRHRTLRLPDVLVLATGEVLEAPVLTCDRAWPRLSKRARVI